MTNPDSDSRDTLICALVNKLGGAVSLQPHEYQIGNVSTQVVQLATGTLHLELVVTPQPTSPNPAPQSTTDGDALMHLGG